MTVRMFDGWYLLPQASLIYLYRLSLPRNLSVFPLPMLCYFDKSYYIGCLSSSRERNTYVIQT